jgi:hypothetical protein
MGFSTFAQLLSYVVSNLISVTQRFNSITVVFKSLQNFGTVAELGTEIATVKCFLRCKDVLCSIRKCKDPQNSHECQDSKSKRKSISVNLDFKNFFQFLTQHLN